MAVNEKTLFSMRSIKMIDVIGEFLLGRFDVRLLIETLFNLVLMEEARVQVERRRRVFGAEAAYRNGYRERHLKTPFGDLKLQVPNFRHFSFQTCLFKPFCRTSRVLEDFIREAYEKGISTRGMQSLLKKLGITGISPTSVSRIMAKLDEKVQDFLKRPLLDEFRYVFLDAAYYSVRTNGRYLNRPLLLAIGVDCYGQWKIIGAKLAFEENEESWREFMRELQERRLSGVELIVSDLRRSVREAARDTFGGVAFQVCNAHLLRQVTGLMAKKDVSLIEKDIELFFHAGESGYENLMRKLDGMGYPEAVRMLQANRQEALTYLSFPFDHRRVIYTTNVIENVHAQVKRRTKKIASFPSEEAAMRIISHLLMRMENEHTIRKTPLLFAEPVKTETEEEEDMILTVFESPKPRDIIMSYFS